MPLPPPTPPLPQPPSSGSPNTAVCYRHAGREAGRRCTRCGKPACNECLVQAQVGSHCVECAKAARPDLTTRAKFWSASQPNLVSTLLVGINVAVFVIVLVWTRDGGALSNSITSVHVDFALSRDVLANGVRGITRAGEVVSITDSGQWYRLLTSGFLHYGVIHLAFNSYFIYIIGPMLERPLGRPRFLLLYFASLFGGSLGVLVLDSGGLTAGASGAAFGLMSALAVGMWRRGINPMSTGIGTTLMLNLFITFAIPGISIGGHLGGAAAGAICGAVMMAPGHKALPRWATFATPVAVGIGSIVLSIAIVLAT